MRLGISLLLFSLSIIAAEKKSYEGYKVFSIVPTTNEHIQTLNQLKENSPAVFWTEHYEANSDVRIMIPPSFEEQFKNTLNENALEPVEAIDNVQRLIDSQLKPATTKRTVRTAGTFDWISYHDLDSIYNWLDELEELYPNVVSTVVIGTSNEGREIKGIVLDLRAGENRETRLDAIIEGGIHSREWISPATVTWIINEFLTSEDSDVKELATTFIWHIFPVFNPDGYVYTFTNDRLWRKNRNYAQTTTCGVYVDDDLSNGIDLNRNFGLRWMTVGASQDPCSQTYAGTAPFSEPESQAMESYVLSVQSIGRVIYYFAFHSYSQLLLIPPSDYTGSDLLTVDNYGDLFEIGARAMDKLGERYGTIYRPGPSTEVLYGTSGGSFDWAKGVANVSISYLVELRDRGFYGFLLPAEQIIPNNEEIVDSLVEMHKVAMDLHYYTIESTADKVGISVCLIIAAAFIANVNLM